MANEGYHEPVDELTDNARDMHRAIVSLTEELEAVDWYNQRVDACKDSELRAILAHNRDEEKEHAAMLLEWIRRQDNAFDKELRNYLFSKKPLTHDRPSSPVSIDLALPSRCGTHQAAKRRRKEAPPSGSGMVRSPSVPKTRAGTVLHRNIAARPSVLGE